MTFNIPQLTQTTIDGFTIRKAKENDTPLVLKFIKQLAVYEKMIDEVVATEGSLKEWLFGDSPFAHVVIGEFNSLPVGFALFFTNFSTFVGRPGIFLEDLFVIPEQRGKGFGKTLLAFLAKLAVDNEFGRVEWAVLDWNEPAIKVYKGIGARSMDEWKVFRLAGIEMENVSKNL
jgi:GNAT superfamily N-acetyltransferase